MKLARGMSANVLAEVNKRKTQILIAVGLFVLVFVVAGLFGDGGAILAAIEHLNFAVIAGMLALSLVNYLLRAWRWQVFSDRLRLGVPFSRNTCYFVAGFALTATPGKVGEALRLWLLKRGHGIAYSRSLGLLFGDRLADTTVIVLLTLVNLQGVADFGWAIVPAVTFVIVLTSVFVRPRLAMAAITRVYGWVGIWPRLFAVVRRAMRHIAHLAKPATYCLVMVLSVIGWLAEAVALYWLLEVMGAPLPLGAVVFVFSFSMLIGAAAMLPGGLGGTEATMIGLLASFGVDFDTAVAATAIIRVTTLWFSVLLGVVALPLSLRLTARERPARVVQAAA